MSVRTERVAELIQQEVAKILQREYAERLQPMVTVTDARVTPDLSIAYLYASVLGDEKEQREATFRHLEALAPEVREKLASEIRHQLRIVPELKFFLDETHQRVERLNTLFDQIQKEREQRGEPSEERAEESSGGEA
ncbi:MAG: 30S ribosome-binding factor RbfA [Bacteroidetes bacterium QS_9_68_14]|nr:MAG: 30S ribosome-binding factor RbfA [Bacteroidetes bacterium QS_9_68_14]